MKSNLPILIALLLSIFIAMPVRAGDGFELEVISDGTLTARITGPEELVKSAQGNEYGVPFAGCLYEIEWGDGQKDPAVSLGNGPPFCASTLTHVYAKPGLYTIKAMTYDPGPTDGMENIQRGTASINVR